MKNYYIDKKYIDIEDEEIDLTEIIKTIIKEKNLVIFTTTFFIMLSFVFIYYKNNQLNNYGVNITLSQETIEKLNQYNKKYPNANIIFEENIQKSFDSLLEKQDINTKIIAKENINELL